jgi:hypothetical protein
MTVADLEAGDTRVADALWYENHGAASAEVREDFIAERCEDAGYHEEEE